MKKKIKPYLKMLSLALLTVAMLLAISNETSAQVSTASAALNGTVRDASGAAVSGATVTLTNSKTGFKQVTKTNKTGDYSLVNISPGTYLDSVSMEGFSTAKTPDFNLAVNQTATINFTLRVGAVNSTVTVAANAVQIESSTSELGIVIGRAEVNDLPLNGRNFTELLLLAPGVSPVNVTENAGFGGIGNPTGTVVLPSVNGQNNRSNMYLLDGINNYGSIRDTYAVQPTLDDIEEFKVQSHNDEAQFGQVLGGIVNVVTKSGTNEFHGDAWEYLRNDAMDAANYFNPDKTPLKQNQFGASVGGPVILPHYNGRNKTFFYGSYEGYRNNTASSNFYRTPTPAQLAGDFSNLDSSRHTALQSVQFGSSRSERPAECNRVHSSAVHVRRFRSSVASECEWNPAGDGDSVQYHSFHHDQPDDGELRTDILPALPSICLAIHNSMAATPPPTSRDQDQVSLRLDQQIDMNDRIFVRWTQRGSPSPDLAVIRAWCRTSTIPITTLQPTGPILLAQVLFCS